MVFCCCCCCFGEGFFVCVCCLFFFHSYAQLHATCLNVRTELWLLWSEGKRHSKPVALWFLQGRHRPHSWVNWGQSVQMGLTRTSTDRQNTGSTRTTTPCLVDNVVRGRGPGFTAFKHCTVETYSSPFWTIYQIVTSSSEHWSANLRKTSQ